MASSLRVNAIVPASGTNVAIGTAGGTITYSASVSGVSTFTTVSATTISATSITGVTTAGITTAYIGSVNDGPISGARNRIINGSFDIWQRGTSGSSGYLADRWLAESTTSISRSTDVPVGLGVSFRYSIEFSNTSATYPLVLQRIESVNCYDLVGKTVTISYWAKNISGAAKIYSELNYANSVDNFTVSTVVGSDYSTATSNPSSSWTYYRTTYTNLPSGVANGLDIRIVRDNASSATTRVTGVQLEVGPTATPFERRSFGQELALCERYYQIKEYNGGTVNMYPGSTNGYFSIPLSPLMRTGPSVVTYDTAYQASGFIYYNGGSTAVTYGNNQAPTVGAVSSAASRTSGNFSTGEVCGHTYVRIRASAEL
jgi:hypothetical protein